MFLEANTEINGSLEDLFCNNTNFAVKPVIVADCDLCDDDTGCCTTCCQPGEECNDGTYVPDLDPIWQLGFQRVFFTFRKDDYFMHEKLNITGYEKVVDFLNHTNVLKDEEES